MSARPAQATQADIARAIRALKAAGYDDVQVDIRPDGVTVRPCRAARLQPWETSSPSGNNHDGDGGGEPVL